MSERLREHTLCIKGAVCGKPPCLSRGIGDNPTHSEGLYFWLLQFQAGNLEDADGILLKP